MKLLRILRFPDILTLTGIVLALFAIRSVIVGNYKFAIGIMLSSVLFDFADGFTARLFGGSIYGKFLDSSYDTMGYLIFPFLYLIIAGHARGVFVVVFMLPVLTGILRLARFTDEGFFDKDVQHYVGMPVFYLALLPIAAYYNIPLVLIAVGAFSVSMLMISEIKFRKPKHPIFGLLLLVAVTFFLV
jgi:phosphatidylserine synthase